MNKYFPVVFGFFTFICVNSNTINQNFSSTKIDRIIVEKQNRSMYLYKKGTLIKKYQIALGFSPVGQKTREGDGKTPEGTYFIASKNPKSAYHLSLKISYPSDDDVLLSKSQGQTPGSNIMIHGIKKGFGWIGDYHRLFDWTRGCIAVTNREIEEIYELSDVGTLVEIKN